MIDGSQKPRGFKVLPGLSMIHYNYGNYKLKSGVAKKYEFKQVSFKPFIKSEYNCDLR